MNMRLRTRSKGELIYKLETVRRVVRLPHRGQSLRVVAFSDYRVQDLEKLLEFIACRPKPDVILYAGDDIQRFRPQGRNLFEELASLALYGLCAVAGNDDLAETRELITGRNVYPVHSCALVIGSFAVVGIEGAPYFPKEDVTKLGGRLNMGYLLYPERILDLHIQRWNALRELNSKKLIIVSHTPPFGTLDLAMRFGRRNIGCRPLQSFLTTSTNSLLCVCGHVHRWGGQTAELGKTRVVNVASHDSPGEPGKVATIQIVRGHVTSVEWHMVR